MTEVPGQPKRYVVDISSERVSVGDGVSIPRTWSLLITDDPAIPGTVRVNAAYDPTLKRAVVAAITVERDGEGQELSSAILREVSVQTALQDSGLHVIRVTEPGHDPETVSDYVRRARSAGRSINMMQLSTTVHRAAYTVSVPPLKFVADQIGMSVSTATRWMARARASGLAEDLVSRETYNRMRADIRNEDMQPTWNNPGAGTSGPSIGL